MEVKEDYLKESISLWKLQSKDQGIDEGQIEGECKGDYLADMCGLYLRVYFICYCSYENWKGR